MLLRLLMPCIIFVLCGLTSLQVKAKSDIIIILDDLGYRPSDVAAFSLPKEITFSILPQTPLASEIALRAEQEGRACYAAYAYAGAKWKEHGAPWINH